MARYDVTCVEDLEPRREQVVAFWRENLPPYGTDERFAWIQDGNPAGRPLTALAFLQGTDTLVGCGSLYPWPCWVNGERSVLWVAIHFAVAQGHRAFGPAFALQKSLAAALRGRGGRFAFVYPNRASVGPFKSAGYEFVGQSHDWARVLDARPQLRARVKSAGLATVGNWAIGAADRGIRRWHRHQSRRFRTEAVARCDARFDALWDRARGQSPFELERSAAFLNWRYGDNPSGTYRFFGLFDAARGPGELDAYLVYTTDRTTATIKDVFPSARDTATPLLSRFVDRMVNDGAESVRISNWGDGEFRETLRRLVFVERPATRDYYFLDAAGTGETSGPLGNPSGITLFFG
jgi:hypothetical protein